MEEIKPKAPKANASASLLEKRSADTAKLVFDIRTDHGGELEKLDARILKLKSKVDIPNSGCQCTYQRACPKSHNLGMWNLRDTDKKSDEVEQWPADVNHPLFKGLDVKDPSIKQVDHIIELNEVKRAAYRTCKAWPADYPVIKAEDTPELLDQLATIFNHEDNLCAIPSKFNNGKNKFLTLAAQPKKLDKVTDGSAIRLDNVLQFYLTGGAPNEADMADFGKLLDEAQGAPTPTTKSKKDAVPKYTRFSTHLQQYYRQKATKRYKTLEKLVVAAEDTSDQFHHFYAGVYCALREDFYRFETMQNDAQWNKKSLAQLYKTVEGQKTTIGALTVVDARNLLEGGDFTLFNRLAVKESKK
ncbi:hypothetical protein OC861_000792 [Tilletia horrida]|nr:hypothetical protein OC861_000792 [Tilletia horrida]